MDRMIECPRCHGAGVVICGDDDYRHEQKCLRCNGATRITDRRAPTANDRAVERIKALLDPMFGSWTADKVMGIINEEAERG